MIDIAGGCQCDAVRYVARAEARPAFKRAFAAQLAVFEQRQPRG